MSQTRHETDAREWDSSVRLEDEMPQTPPERKLESPDSPRKAGVVPFERPQNDAQRTIRRRVQERLDRERIKPRISPVRLIVTLAVAIIPVMLTFSSADAVLRRVQLLTKLYITDAPKETVPAPEEEENPGVLIVMPDPTLDPRAPEISAPPPATPRSPPQQSAPKNAPQK
jgi:hypothetical protein